MEKIIEIIGLTKVYSGGVVGIDNLSLKVDEGEIFGFLGANGAGKTTTIRLLINLIFPTSGKAYIFGKDVVKEHINLCEGIGYIPSGIRPHRNMTGHEYLKYLSLFYPDSDGERREYLLELFEFSERDLNRKFKEYSGGMARKLALVQAFQHSPRLVILDEPTEGLDPVMQHNFYEMLREYKDNGGTVFISSHHLREVEQVCDRAAIIREGKLVSIEKVHDLMEQTSRVINVVFKDIVSIDDLKNRALKIDEFDGKHLRGRITGDINDVIKILSKKKIKDMSMPRLSLEDIFLDYYREE